MQCFCQAAALARGVASPVLAPALGCPCGAAPCWGVPAAVPARLCPWGQRAALPAAGCAAVSLHCRPSLTPRCSRRHRDVVPGPASVPGELQPRGEQSPGPVQPHRCHSIPGGSAPRPRCGGQCLGTAICFPKAGTGDRWCCKLLWQERLMKEMSKGLFGTEPFYLFA